MYYIEIKKKNNPTGKKYEKKRNLAEINRLFSSKASLVSVKNFHGNLI